MNLTRNDFDQLKKVVEAKNQQPTNKDKQNPIITPSFEIENEFSIGQLFSSLVKAVKNVGKILDNPGRALELAAYIGTAATSKNSKLIAATAPDIIKFVHQGKGL